MFAKIFRAVFFVALVSVSAQNFSVNKIEPPNWWAGMKTNEIELLVYGENLANTKVFSENDAIKIIKYEPNFSGKYLFVTVKVNGATEPDDGKIIFVNEGDSVEINYPILKREFPAESHAGFSEKDVVYLITPDRFANGDETNDTALGAENLLNRAEGLARHGGDIEGIIRHLDYFNELGVTALWINPLLENNMPISYHGYAATDLYNVDPRFGNNELYKKLVGEAHRRDIKIIYDHVSNHVGINHKWVENPPCEDWFHGTPQNHLPALHEKMALFDIHADSNIVKRVLQGWFVNEMPDLNQSNPHVARYLIQNAIWWIEFAGIDGFREDTYAYVNQKFLKRLVETLKNEYPNFEVVGEVWTGEPEFLAPYLKNNKFGNENTELNVVTDFAFRDALADFLGGGNLQKLYDVMCKDFIYAPENKFMTFLDNHDLQRPLFIARGNTDKVKTAFAMLFTLRGIPQILYGDEIAMYGGKEHGEIRSDFPGGWKDDKRNAFTEKGRTKKENEIFNFVKRLILLRKNHPALQNGKLTHYPPYRNVYTYVRENGEEKFLVIVNGNGEKAKVGGGMFKDLVADGSEFVDAFSGREIEIGKAEIAPYGFLILRAK